MKIKVETSLHHKMFNYPSAHEFGTGQRDAHGSRIPSYHGNPFANSNLLSVVDYSWYTRAIGSETCHVKVFKNKNFLSGTQKISLYNTLQFHLPRDKFTWSRQFLAVWYKTKFGSQNCAYQLWCLFCNICNVFKNMFNVPLIIMW